MIYKFELRLQHRLSNAQLRVIVWKVVEVNPFLLQISWRSKVCVCLS